MNGTSETKLEVLAMCNVLWLLEGLMQSSVHILLESTLL